MREGSLEAPVRHPVDWENPEFYDEEKLDEELRRVFDICHGCRRCFNLCDSFPRLFDLVDEAPSEELDTVDSQDFKSVVDACTLCDMCYMTKCPYVPPHEFNLDFPHLMLRYRAVEHKKGETSFVSSQLAKTDRNGKIGKYLAPIANWSTDKDNKTTRSVLESTLGIHKEAALPKYHSTTLTDLAEKEDYSPNADAPAFGRKAVIYATCFSNYNSPQIGDATLKVLAKNGVETVALHPKCCGMPLLEQGNIKAVTENAKVVADALIPWVEKGYDIIALVSSCALMLKFEWPLLSPENEDLKTLANATFDVSEYVVDIAKKEGLADGLTKLDGPVAMHLACHARAQNMGAKGAEMLRLIPETRVAVVERCSGHGGSWGIMKENFDTAIKVGRTAAKNAMKSGAPFIASECPLAAEHLMQGIELQDAEAVKSRQASHPIELIAKSYDLL